MWCHCGLCVAWFITVSNYGTSHNSSPYLPIEAFSSINLKMKWMEKKEASKTQYLRIYVCYFYPGTRKWLQSVVPWLCKWHVRHQLVSFHLTSNVIYFHPRACYIHLLTTVMLYSIFLEVKHCKTPNTLREWDVLHYKRQTVVTLRYSPVFWVHNPLSNKIKWHISDCPFFLAGQRQQSN